MVEFRASPPLLTARNPTPSRGKCRFDAFSLAVGFDPIVGEWRSFHWRC